MKKKTANSLFKNLKWDPNGLVPCVVQDVRDGSVLMVAYMNRASLRRTIGGGQSCFWSRSRNKFWLKGEESGNFQKVEEIFLDCDGDCILLKVKQIGGAACHTGMRSCFFRKVVKGKHLTAIGKKVFDPKKVYR